LATFQFAVPDLFKEVFECRMTNITISTSHA
jgi:hypothetical protein